MEKHKLIDELEKRLMEGLKIWAANLPHYSNVYMILDQYSVEYINRVHIIKNIKNNGKDIPEELLRYILNEKNSLEFLIQIKNKSITTSSLKITPCANLA